MTGVPMYRWLCECGLDNSPAAEKCARCGAPRDQGILKAAKGPVSGEERTAALQARINWMIRDGWRVTRSGNNWADLMKPRPFLVGNFLLSLLVPVVGLLLFLIYHFAIAKDQYVRVQVDEYGRVHKVAEGHSLQELAGSTN